jgi:hypothetical protein
VKALSVRQPYAALILDGAKTIEVRSWPTDHRGELLICVTAAPKNVFWRDPEDNVNRLLHAGCMYCIVELLDCRPMLSKDADEALCEYTRGAWAWDIEVTAAVRPDRYRGALGLFDVPDELIHRLPSEQWVYDHPTPQGDIKFTKKSPLLDLGA